MCLDKGYGGLNALHHSGKLNEHLESLPELTGIDPTNKNNDIGSLVNQYVVAGDASAVEAQLLSALVERVSNKDISVLQVSHNDSATDPRKDRWGVTISGPCESKDPPTYVRAKTRVGMEFINSMKTILNDNNSEAYVLGWKKLKLLISTLMGLHVDQSTRDVDSDGLPNEYANRTVTSSGMPSKVTFVARAIKVEEKTSSSITDDDDDDEFEDIEGVPEYESASAAVPNVGTSMSMRRKNSTLRYRQKQLGKYTIYIDAGIHSYTLGPKGAGRHILGKVKIEGEWWAVVLFHSPEANTDVTSSLQTRIALITTTFHDSEEQSDAQMADIRNCRHLIPNLAVDALNVSTVSTSTEIDGQLQAVVPYDPNKDEREYKCLLCGGDEKATHVDTRNLRNQPEIFTNDNGVKIGVGCFATLYYDEESSEDEQEDAIAPSAHTTQYCGVISHVNTTASTATVHLGDGSTDNVSIDLLYPAKETNPESFDTAAIEQNLRCAKCVHGDPELYNQGYDELASGLVVPIESMCTNCWCEPKLGKMRGCANCLGTDGGTLKCIGYNKILPGGETERAFACTGTSTGVSLTNENIGNNTMAACKECLALYKAHSAGTKKPTTSHANYEEIWREFWGAYELESGLYSKIWKGKQVPNTDAMLGFVEGTPRLGKIWNQFSAEYETLCADLGDKKALRKVKDQLQSWYNNTFKRKNNKCTISIETDNKCPACNNNKTCQWIDEEDPQPVDSLESLEAFLIHGGKFGKEKVAATTSKSNKNRKRKA